MKKVTKLLFLGSFTLIAFYFRASGLFHGLDDGVVFHPDTPKQVVNLEQGLLGKHIHYTGSLFYDGYPYGLNRIDELVVRGLRIAWTPMHHLLHGDGVPFPFSERLQHYYIVRVLRLLYGMIAFGLLVRTSFLLFPKPFVPLCVMLLYAVAPLASTVTHAASGDIGLDLFLSITLYVLARHVLKPKPFYLVVAGVSVGMAFACKYQGAMGAWIVALYLFVRFFSWELNAILDFFKKGVLSAGGFFAGVLLLTPGLWVDPSVTWKLMRKNFEFIKNYGVPTEFLDLPLSTRIYTGLTQNIPVVFTALNLFLVLTGMLSLILVVYRKITRSKTEDAVELNAYWLALASFPFMFILLSTAMKPMVQPFHFSFVLLPLILSVGFIFHDLHSRFGRKGRGLAISLGVIIFLSSLWVALLEDAFWRKPSIVPAYNNFAVGSTEAALHISRDSSRSDIIKSFYLHPSGLSVFRNRPKTLSSRDAAWWNTHQQLPLPSRPLRDDVPGWIFLNGPFFPNNDHSFKLDASNRSTVNLVQEDSPIKTLQLGLRSGIRPTYLSGRIGNNHFSAFLPPHSQEILTVSISDAQFSFPSTKDHPATFVYELDVEASPGAAWVDVIRSEKQLETYKMFGPTPASAPPLLSERSVTVLSRTRFLGSASIAKIDDAETMLFSRSRGLPAGSYTLSSTFINTASKTAQVQFALGAESDEAAMLNSAVMTVPVGLSSQQVVFHKPFDPFEVELSLLTKNKGLLLKEWSLRPAPDQQILASESGPARMFHPLDLTYDNGLKLTGFLLRFPDSLTGKITWGVQAQFPKGFSSSVFEESVIFIHLLGEDGSLFQALDIPLLQASYLGGKQKVHHATLTNGLGSLKRLTVQIGIYNPRTRIRMNPKTDNPLRMDQIDDRAITLQSFDAPFVGKTFP